MENNRRYREGFSLIEVIIAVAILAILSVPILLYFTNSAIHTAHGKHEQAADLAAQSVIEEIDSISNFNNIEEKLVALRPVVADENGEEAGWEMLDKAESSVADDDTGKTFMTRKGIKVDGTSYIAEVMIDYGAYGPAGWSGGVTPNSLFNSYQEPHFQEVYSEGSVVITEDSSVFNIGIGNLYYKLNPGVPSVSEDAPETAPVSGERISRDTIKNAAHRTLVIRITEDTPGSAEFVVTGYSKFEVTTDVGSAETEVPLESNKVEKSKLQNIYYIFMPAYGDADNFGGEIHQSVEIDALALTEAGGVNYADNVSYHFIRQNTYTVADGTETKDTSPRYFLAVSNNNPSTNTKYYSNPDDEGNGVVLDGATSSGMFAKDEPGKSKRIARIDVKVYDAATGIQPGKELAQNTTSKSI
ncbi:MAG: prepilin-type N-terminal cleavage/methylation domain-containing protein [Eubacterium sp.]|nr:prepilin-type N-terminal cleavage/methylation domain-containing protein [Eubacterium sp.]